MAGEHLLVEFLHRTWNCVVLYTLDGTFVRELALPPLGAIGGIWAKSSDPEIFLVLEETCCFLALARWKRNM